METPSRAWAPALVWLVVALLVSGACGGSTSGIAGHSPTPQASSSPSVTSSPPDSPGGSPSPQASKGPTSPSPASVAGAYGVLVGAQSGAAYTVSLVGTDAKVVASAQASTPTAVTCANAAGGVVPLPVSTSNSRLYFMDGQGVVRFLAANGDTGRATSVPVGSARRSMFAVSPDDQRIAVVVADFNSTGASTRLYVEDLNGGGNHIELFTQGGAYTLWPIGWRGTTSLVVAKVPACSQGGGPLCCGPQELHVVDPTSAVRRFTIGGTTCVIAGAPSPAGAVCEDTATFSKATVLTWTATAVRSVGVTGPTPAYLSPDGTRVALTLFSNGTTFVDGADRTLAMQACGWIDGTHVMAGGDAQQQPRVGDVSTGTVVPVPAQGACGGRLPGGL